MARHARRLAVLLTLILVVTLGFPGGALKGSWPTSWFDLRWSWGDAAAAYVGVPVQKRGPGDGSHYVGKSAGYRSVKAKKRPTWTPPVEGDTDSFDPKKSTKISGRSTESADVYRNTDGSETVTVSAGERNYQGADGKWRPIDTDLKPDEDGRLRTEGTSLGISLAGEPTADVTSQRVAAETREAKPAAPAETPGQTPAPSETAGSEASETAGSEKAPDDLARVTLDSGEVFGYRLQDAAPVAPVVDGADSTYPEILPGVDLRLHSQSDRLKEILVLKSPSAPREFVFRLTLDGLTPRLTADGSLELSDKDGEVRLIIPKPFMEDSSPVDELGSRKRSYDVAYSLTTVGDQPALKVTASGAWLDDPARVWPVELDPTVYEARTNGTAGVFVDNNTATTATEQLSGALAAGRTATVTARTYLQFGAFATGNFTGKKITAAKLWVYHTYSPSCTVFRNSYVHRITGAWTPATVAQATAVSGGPAISSTRVGTLAINDHTTACANTTGDQTKGQWRYATLDTTVLHDWSTNTTTAGYTNGLAILGDETVTDSWKRFAPDENATYKPYLQLTYSNNVAPQVNALFPASGTQSSTLTPQLTADGFDPDGFPSTLEYNFEIFSESATGAQTKLTESGWRTDKTWTVPSGVLKWGGRYRWQATLHDGRTRRGVASYAWQPDWRYVLTTPVPQPAVTSTLDDNGEAGFAAGSGSYTTAAKDAQVAAVGPALEIARSYNSADNRTTGAFGAGWSSILDARVTERKNVAGTLVTAEVTYPTGQTVAYGRNADGTFSAGLGRYARFSAVTGGYKLVDKSGVAYLFTTAAGTGVYGLTSVTDGNGRALTLTYTSGKVTKLTAVASARNLAITWTGNRVTSVATDEAVTGDATTTSVWSYTYSGDQLTKVCPPISSTQCTVYGYTDANLYSSAVENLDPFSYWRLGEAAGSAQAKSAALERMGADVGQHTSVTLGQAGPLTGSTATAATYNGTTSRTSLPAKQLTQSGYQSVSMWFKTSATGNDHVLYGQSWDPITTAVSTSPYQPVLYIGTNGQLHGGFPTTPVSGYLGSITGQHSGRCLDVTDGGASNGDAVILYGCHGKTNQLWTLTTSGQLQYTYNSVTRCMREDGNDAGSRVVVQDCNASAADQKWRLTGDGRLVSQESGLCMHPLANGVDNLVPLTVWPCDRPYRRAQTWQWSAHTPMTFTGNVADGQWHHVVLSGAGDRQTLYLDGVQKATQTGIRIADILPGYQYAGAGLLGGGWPAQDNTVVNTNNGTPDLFVGSLSDVAVFDRPLTTDLVAELYAAKTPRKLLSQITRPSGAVTAKVKYNTVSGKVEQVTDANNGMWTLGQPKVAGSSQVYAAGVLAGNPVDYWRLNDLPGVAEPYNQVSGNSATYAGTVLGGTPGTDGPFKDTTAPLFDGVSGTGITSDGPSIDTTQSFSISAWVKPSDLTAHRQVVSAVGGVFSAVSMGYDPSTNKWQVIMCTADDVTALCPRIHAGTNVPSTSTWTHLATTFDSPTKTLRVYVNGKLEGSGVFTHTLWKATDSLVIGKCRSMGADCGLFKGRIAEVATYASRLSDAEILAQYEAADRDAGAKAIPMPAKSISVTGPVSTATSSQVYSLESGQQIASEDTLGNLTQYGYDIATGAMTLMVDPNGNKTEYGYDVRGNVTEQSTWQKQTDESTKSTTRFTYYPDATTLDPAPDPRNDKVLTTRDALNQVTTYTYDTAGNLTKVTDPLGRVSSATMTVAADNAPAGMATKQLTPGGALTTTKYATNGDILEVVDPAGLITRMTYDKLGRLLTQTEITKTDPAGRTTRLAYDKLGRLTTVTEPGVLNRVTGAVHTAVTTYTYNADGQSTSTTVSDTTGGDASRAETLTYNGLGHLVERADALGNRDTYTYDAYGRMITSTDPAGTTVQAAYDSEGQTLTMKFKNFTGDPDDPSPATDVTSESRAYDAAGRLVRTTDVMGWSTEYEYTQNNLLAKSTRVDGTKSYVLDENTYDAAGNLVKQVTNDGQTTTVYTLDAASRAYRSTVDPTGVNRQITHELSPDDQILSTTVRAGDGTLAGYEETIHDPVGRELVTTAYPKKPGTAVGRWPLSATSGTTAADSVGNLPAEFRPTGVQWSSDHPPSRSDLSGSVQVSFAEQGGLSTASPAVDPKRSYTVSAWVKIVNPAARNYAAVGQESDNYSAFSLGYYGNTGTWRMMGCRKDVTCGVSLSTAPAATDTWTHLAGVHDASAKTMSLYVNGVLQQTVPYTGADNPAQPLSIGDLKWTGVRKDQWPGNIADVQLYQSALDATALQKVYSGANTAETGEVMREAYQRDTDGAVLASVDGIGNETRFEYDEAGRLAVTVEPSAVTEVHGGTPVTANPVSFIGYNTFGEVTEDKDPTGNVLTTRYDANGREIGTIYPAYTPPGSSTPLTPQDTVSYDSIGQVTKVTDPLGAETSFTYDMLGRVTKQTNPDGGAVRYTYDLAGDVLSVTDPLGAKQTATYDYLGRQLTGTEIVRQTSANHTTAFTYGAGGWLTKVTSPDGVTGGYTYNAIGEVTSETDAANTKTTFRYDGAGRVSRTTYADGVYEEPDFDLAGRQYAHRVHNAAGTLLQRSGAEYDRDANLITSEDAKGNRTRFVYDATGLLTSQTEPVSATESITTSFGYDISGQPTRFTDGRGNDFWTTYNSWGIPESNIEPATSAHTALADRTFTTVYDAAGQPVEEIQPGGVRLTHTYDAMGRVVRSSGTGAEAQTADREFGYDRGGNLVTLSGTGGDNELAWDDRGLLTSVAGPSGNSSFTYTADGQPKTRTDAAGTTTYGYDAAGRLSSIANPATGVQAQVGYDTLSQITKVTYGDNGNTRWFGYDDLRRLTTDDLRKPGGDSIAKIAYGYDPNSNLTSKVTTGFAGSSANAYTYDQSNRLTSWDNGTTTVGYEYDKSGNRTRAGDKTFTYDNRNRLLTSSTGDDYEYTARGTLRRTISGTVARETRTDAFGQVIQQQDGEDSFVDYQYDGLGRVMKDGFAYTGLGNDLATDGTALYTRDVSGGVFGIQQDGVSTYAWTDRHTDVVAQFTAAGTALTGSTTYDPLGKVVATAGATGSLGFQQEYTEPSTGRVNMHARWYNPETGQFDTRDSANLSPVGDSANANRYGYANGNPLNGIDPSGHSVLSMSGCSSTFTCLLQGFVNSFDFIDMASSVVNALSDVMGTVKSLYSDTKSQASTWSSRIKGAIKDRINCDAWWMPISEKKCNSVVGAISTIGGWACAATSVCDVVYDCYNADRRNSCAVQIGELLAGAVTSIVGGAVYGLATKLSKKISKLRDRFNIPKKRTGSSGGFGPEDEKRYVIANPAKRSTKAVKDGGAGKIKCSGKKCKKKASDNKDNRSGKKKDNKGGKKKDNKGGKKKGKGKGKAKPVVKPSTPKRTPAKGGKPPVKKPAKPTPVKKVKPVLLKSEADPGRSLPTAAANDSSGTSDHYGTCERPHSFDPATRVLMADGSTKAIGEIKLGDKVAATDPKTGETSAQQVVVLHNNLDTHLAEVTVSTQPAESTRKPETGEGKDGRSTRGPTETVLQTTQNHPFWDATRQDWVEAADLEPGRSTLIGPDGELQHVTAVRAFTGAKQMRDLTVDTIHTYHVLADDAPVLVHNNDEPAAICGRSTAKELRNSPGVASGREGAPVRGNGWLQGSHGNAGRIPGQIADQLRGRSFDSFADFREEFWRAVGNDSGLASGFSSQNVARMQAGNSPFVSASQQYGGGRNYVLHHSQPIQHDGGVYDMDNLVVVTPLYHSQILSPSYHYGNG
ncbi:LamG-like jellyroll fold domain-containing protein [Actinoplanes missouriensis]|uniref:LamG-like jellyroll fold domain-containing protein n=1 Tax=Actinoplanes missouriensis TaxID=1866 RepID=UPI0033F2F232